MPFAECCSIKEFKKGVTGQNIKILVEPTRAKASPFRARKRNALVNIAKMHADKDSGTLGYLVRSFLCLKNKPTRINGTKTLLALYVYMEIIKDKTATISKYGLLLEYKKSNKPRSKKKRASLASW